MATASPSAASLHGAGVPPDRVRRIADTLGLGGAVPEGDGRVVALLGDDDPSDCAADWTRPFAAWIEVAGLDDAAVCTHVSRAVQADLYASLTTATANRLHLAGRMVHAIGGWRPLTETQHDDVELVLHEAISNAVVHGNLQVEGMKGLSVDALDRFSSALTSRMSDPSFAARRVEVSCWLKPDDELLVEVADEGSGFVPQIRTGAVTEASGRGLDLIAAIAREVELLDSGRRIRIRFAL